MHRKNSGGGSHRPPLPGRGLMSNTSLHGLSVTVCHYLPASYISFRTLPEEVDTMMERHKTKFGIKSPNYNTSHFFHIICSISFCHSHSRLATAKLIGKIISFFRDQEETDSDSEIRIITMLVIQKQQFYHFRNDSYYTILNLRPAGGGGVVGNSPPFFQIVKKNGGDLIIHPFRTHMRKFQTQVT